MSRKEDTSGELLETAVEELSNGEASDWIALVKAARSSRERQLLAQLQIVSRIADVHRGLQGELPPGPCLVVREPDGVSWHHLLGSDPVSIGRSSANYIVFQKISLSRNHARIRREGKRYVVEDMGSRNGTWVNGVKLQAPLELLDGDEIRVGSCRITFLIGGRSPAPGAESDEESSAPDR